MMQWGDESRLIKFLNSCIYVTNCYKKSGCGKLKSSILETCHIPIYEQSDEFQNCSKIILSEARDCRDFPSPCEIFGENNCVKPLYVETCGHEIWTKFKAVR